MGSSHLVIDGSNIATEGRSMPSLAQLLDAVEAAKADLGADTVTTIVDATFGHRISEDEQEAFEDKISSGEILIPPAGVIGRGDAFILQVADRADAVVLSNDSFQEFHGTYRWLFDEGRLLGGKHVPGVGWIFLARSPVRGAVSRKAVADAKKKRSATTSTKKAKATKAGGSGRSRSAKKQPAKKQPAKKQPAKKAEPKRAEPKRAAAKKAAYEPEPYNEPLPFIEFVGAHAVGSTVEAEVEQFSSHGAYVLVGETRCYVPLKAMGDPPPRSARDALDTGQTHTFVVEAIDTPRRGIDLRLVTGKAAPSAPARKEKAKRDDRRPAEPETRPEQPEERLVTEAEVDDETLSVSQRRKLRAQLAAQDARMAEEPETPDVGAAPAAAKKPPKKSTARRATTKKAAATTEKDTATKTGRASSARKTAPAKKATTTKKTASTSGRAGSARKTTPAKKASPAKKAAAGSRKAAAGSRKAAGATKKAATKKATTKKAAAKTPAKKKKASPAKKAARARSTKK